MCGRFVQTSDIRTIKKLFNVQDVEAIPSPRYNIAPSQDIAAVIHDKATKLINCRWGFIPSWAKDESIGYKMINARAETVAAKPAFKHAFMKQRCLIVADGFYEWQKKENGKTKHPFYITLKSDEPFGFAGLYNIWVSPDGRHICTGTIITTEANELLKPIHDRMPVIMPKDKQEMWLDNNFNYETELKSMLRKLPSANLKMYQVSTRVNFPKNDSPDNIRPV
jgi:putative SOS response-associated peptidase YedK